MRTDPLLIVLDEPSAALDPRAEHDLYTAFARQSRIVASKLGTITVLVSHRFSTVRSADHILVLWDGGVTETGTHEQLMSADGTYAEHYRVQASGYVPQAESTAVTTEEGSEK